MGVFKERNNTMNINNAEDLEKLKMSDLFEAVASEKSPIPVYRNGEALEPRRFSALGEISYSDAIIVLNINTELRQRFIAEYPEYGAAVAKPGDVVCFGSYPVVPGGPKESIEWIVLARDRNNIKLVSKKGIDCKSYHGTYENVDWEHSDLRKWLGTEFVDAAFTKEEKAMIPYTSVKVDKADNIYANHGSNTSDKVFLLSATEAKLYFETNEDRKCFATEYAVSKGAYVNEETGNCWYWLRTPGWAPMAYCQTNVNHKGEVSMVGDSVEHTDNAIRPVIWVGLD